MYRRIIDLGIVSEQSIFLLGARQTGKSTLLRQLYPGAKYYDLLLSDVYRSLLNRPSLIREELDAEGISGRSQKSPVIIDEVQKIPELLDEVHWLIENRGIKFILCGSSARKLRRGHANLLGGRAVKRELKPLVFAEVPQISLEKALTSGLLPRHYISDAPQELINTYVGSYLKEEIAAEALTRNLPAFSRFMEVAALSNGEIVNYLNIARECGVSAPTVKEYYQILCDTLIANELPAFAKRKKRRLIFAPKYYFFDVGLISVLTRRGKVVHGTETFGRAFEHYMQMELVAHREYSGLRYLLSYWRTASQFEVDFVLGDAEVAIEVKSSVLAKDQHLKGLRAFKEEHQSARCILVSLDKSARKTRDEIEIMPWAIFLEKLWDGKIIK